MLDLVVSGPTLLSQGGMGKPAKKLGNKLEKWEVALVKGMLERGGYNDQDIQAYFTRPTRSINHARVLEIRKGDRHKTAKAASPEELDRFLSAWPDLDPETGLSNLGDELLIKAREAMIAAVHTFNGAGLTFRAELFIVTCVIAWTYLLHAWFKREGIDYRHTNKDGTIAKTKHGADRYWDLGQCMKHDKCPVKGGVVKNLEFIIDLRHEIEHRSTNRIDDSVGAQLQACCINFNDAVTSLFGPRHGLERRLPIALQFVSFRPDQRAALKKASSLPPHVGAFLDTFENAFTEADLKDPAYRYLISFMPKLSGKPTKADVAIEFIAADSAQGQQIHEIVLKEVDKARYTGTQVLARMKIEGYPKFNSNSHMKLWKALDAKNPGKGYGKEGDYKGYWVWNDRWLEHVREHCQEKGDLYK